MTLDDVRRFALSLPETTEAPHHERTSFRVRGKIFATALPDAPDSVNVLLDEPDARAAVFEDADAHGELWWGKRLVGVKVTLPLADPRRVEELLTEAWLRRAPTTLADQLHRRGS
jgi:hypothetical protein